MTCDKKTPAVKSTEVAEAAGEVEVMTTATATTKSQIMPISLAASRICIAGRTVVVTMCPATAQERQLDTMIRLQTTTVLGDQLHFARQFSLDDEIQN